MIRDELYLNLYTRIGADIANIYVVCDSTYFNYVVPYLIDGSYTDYLYMKKLVGIKRA